MHGHRLAGSICLAAILAATGSRATHARQAGPVSAWMAQDLQPPASPETESQDICAAVPRVQLDLSARATAVPASEPREDAAVNDTASAAVSEPAAAPDPSLPAPPPAPLPPAEPAFLQSRGLPVARTQYDPQWEKVREAALSLDCAETITGLQPPLLTRGQLFELNRTVNQAIRYVDDRALTGSDDSWATADETLRRGAGDCEDIAILKMQLLAALGVPERTLYLTMVRDTIRRKDHAVLIVALNGRDWLLDSAVDQVLDAEDANSYAPVITLSGPYKWLHGGQPAQLSALSSPRSGP